MRIPQFLPFLLSQSALALELLRKEPSANGFPTAFRGWTSFPLQTYKVDSKTYGSAFLNAANITAQAKALASLNAGYNTVMIDSGWSANEGDDNGRIVWDSTLFPNFPDFVKDLKEMGLKVGVYIIPGVFTSDVVKGKEILNSEYTMADINAPCTDSKVFPCGFLRTDLGFADEKQRNASRAWVQSVVDQFAEWDIDLIKFDYLHPKVSPDGDDTGLPPDYSNANDVKAYHNAIVSNSKGKKMWLLESYNLDTSENSLPLWRDTGDSYRLTTDINNSAPGDGTSTLVSWFAIQRAFEAMRIYISVQLSINRPLKGYPDLDSLIIGNSAPLNQINDDQRRTYMSLWIMTGVPMYLADDLTKLEGKYKAMLTNKDMLAIYDNWTSKVSPAFYLNPDGSRNPSQLQIWEAGPFGEESEVVVMLANLGCKENDRYVPPWDDGTTSCVKGKQMVTADFDILQLDGTYCVHAVWEDQNVGAADDRVEWELDEGQSVVLKLTPKSKASDAC